MPFENEFKYRARPHYWIFFHTIDGEMWMSCSICNVASQHYLFQVSDEVSKAFNKELDTFRNKHEECAVINPNFCYHRGRVVEDE